MRRMAARSTPRSLLVAFAIANGAMVARAQGLELDARGGSLPGIVELDAYPAQSPFELMVIVPSGS